MKRNGCPVVHEGMMGPQEYRTIVIKQHGRRPPCVKCSDRTVSFCMKTGFQCREFNSYVAVPIATKILRRLHSSRYHHQKHY